MNRKKYNTLLVPAIATGLLISLAQTSFALPFGSNQGKPGERVRVSSIFDIGSFFRPPGRSQPRTSMGGGVRGQACDAASDSQSNFIQALVPHKDSALTAKDSDKISLAVRTKGLHGKTGTLTVTDNVSYIHEEEVTIPGDGILVVNFDSMDELKQGEYDWSLQVMCGDESDVNDPSVVSSLIVSDLTSSTSTDVNTKIAEDAKQGLWYNALSSALFESSEKGNYEPLKSLLSAIEGEAPDESIFVLKKVTYNKI